MTKQLIEDAVFARSKKKPTSGQCYCKHCGLFTWHWLYVKTAVCRECDTERSIPIEEGVRDD